MEKLIGNLQETACCCLFSPILSVVLFFIKAVFQGDGLEIVRLNLSVGGWELPSGRNAKGCLEAVKNTAGECPIKRAKKGGAF